MKNIALYAFAAFIVLFSGCKQNVDLTSDYKETPIVYGLLNAQENTHYIRIQKGYLIDGNAYTAGGVADSIYYRDSLIVQVIRLNDNGTQSGPALIFNKIVNALPKDSGIFANNPNVLYSYVGALDEAKRYKLQIINTVSGDTISTLTTLEKEGINLVQNFLVVTPIEDNVPGNNLLNLTPNVPYTIRWSPAANGSIYDIKMRFPYQEYNQADNSLVADTFVEFYILKGEAGTIDNNFLSATFNPAVLLNNLAAKLEVRNDRYRTFNETKGIELYFSVGATDLARYINAQVAQGSGIASNEALPPYTNIKGGYGIFSSRFSKVVNDILLTGSALDTLSCNPITAPLRFRGSNDQVCF